MSPRLRHVLIAPLALLTLLSAAVTTFTQNSSLYWDEPKTVRRVQKKARVIRPGRRAVERKPLLALKLQLYLVTPDGKQVETNHNTTFHAGDRLRLGVTANQEGYLYIVQRESADAGGMILFPDSRADYGRNYFRERNKEFIVPNQCPGVAAARDCSYTVPPSGKPVFTLLFSRDNLNLPPAGSPIAAAQLRALEGDSKQNLSEPESFKNAPYSLLIVNKNAQDNEEIVQNFALKIGE